MSVETSMDITGLREALTELGKLDKTARFKAAAKIKASSPEMLAEARRQFPSDIGVSVMHGMAPPKKGKARLEYEKKEVDKGVQIIVGGRARIGVTPLVTLVQKSAAGALFSQAGTKDSSGQFTRQLASYFGRPQRGLWRSRKFVQEQGTADIMRAVDEVIADANRALQARTAS